MAEYDWKAVIKTNIFLLKVAGLWPRGNESYKFNLYTFYAIFSFIMFQVAHTSAQMINLFFIYDDLEALTGTIFVLLTKVLGVLKSFCFIKNMRTLKEFMVIFDTDLFQPKNIEQRVIAESNTKFWKITFISFWFTSVGFLIIITMYPILSGASTERRLPFLAWYPYDYKKSPLYEITYIYQVFCTLFLITAGVDMDTLIAALNMHVGTQFDILCDNLTKLRLDENESITDFIKCIRHHRGILSFVKDFNRFINWILLLQFFTGSVSLGFSMFQLTLVAPLSSEFYSFVLYGVAMTCEIFIFCWFGNEVAVKSDNIVYALFEAGWPGASVPLQKCIILFMLNSQKRVELSTFGIVKLSLTTYIKIIKTAWSYFALLHSVEA